MPSHWAGDRPCVGQYQHNDASDYSHPHQVATPISPHTVLSDTKLEAAEACSMNAWNIAWTPAREVARNNETPIFLFPEQNFHPVPHYFGPPFCSVNTPRRIALAASHGLIAMKSLIATRGRWGLTVLVCSSRLPSPFLLITSRCVLKRASYGITSTTAKHLGNPHWLL
jgi:hypothetical protein